MRDTAHNAKVTGVEVFTRGEETARLAIVTTGKISAQARAKAQELAQRIRERIRELESLRTGQPLPTGAATSGAKASSVDLEVDADEAKASIIDESKSSVGEALPVADVAESSGKLAAAISSYVQLTADTGAATLFVFRDELNQVLTHAFTASKPRLDSARAAVEGVVEEKLKPAWSAVTQWKDVDAAKAKAKAALEDARARVLRAKEQATTWTNLAFNEFAATAPVARGIHALPTSFAAGLQYVLQRMAQPAARANDEADAAAAGVAKPTNNDDDDDDDEQAIPVHSDVVDAVVVADVIPTADAADAAAAAAAAAASPTEEEVVPAGDADADAEEQAGPQGGSAADAAATTTSVTFELDEEAPEWYFSVDGVDPDDSGSEDGGGAALIDEAEEIGRASCRERV